MESHNYVLGLLESILGKGKKDRSSHNYVFNCPVCNHKKPKLVVNVKTGQYNCWTCQPATKGKTPVSLLVKLAAPKSAIVEMKSYFTSDSTNIDDITYTSVELPSEFISLSVPTNNLNIERRRAIAYLKNRGIDQYDALKYNIGYCESGRFRNRIVVPSYDSNGKLNYFIARSMDPNAYIKYDAPSVSKTDIIGLEYFINWSVPVILCEGVFDAMAIKRNAIPLFGKTIPKALMLKLVESQVKTVYLALDNDALKSAIQYAQTLLDYGKEVYLIELNGKDPSELGFEKMTQLLQQAKPLTFSDLLIRRMEILK